MHCALTIINNGDCCTVLSKNKVSCESHWLELHSEPLAPLHISVIHYYHSGAHSRREKSAAQCKTRWVRSGAVVVCSWKWHLHHMHLTQKVSSHYSYDHTLKQRKTLHTNAPISALDYRTYQWLLWTQLWEGEQQWHCPRLVWPKNRNTQLHTPSVLSHRVVTSLEPNNHYIWS